MAPRAKVSASGDIGQAYMKANFNLEKDNIDYGDGPVQLPDMLSAEDVPDMEHGETVPENFRQTPKSVA